MSDQVAVNNQARPSMAAPVLLGAVGAGAGAWFSPFVKKGYRSYEELLAMSKDTFEPVQKAAEALKDNAEVKKAYDELVVNREGLAEFETFATDNLKNEGGLEKIFAKYEFSEESKKAFKDAIKDAEEAITKAGTDEAAVKSAKEAYNKQALEKLKELISKDAIKTDADAVARDMKTLKKILPKGRWLGGILFAAVGLLVGRIIAGAANKKNQA